MFVECLLDCLKGRLGHIKNFLPLYFTQIHRVSGKLLRVYFLNYYIKVQWQFL